MAANFDGNPAGHRTFRTLEGLRGAAAVAVVFYHMPGFWRGVFGHAYLAVDLFFLISGVVIGHAYGARLGGGWNPAEFFAVRLKRLAPLYFLGVLIGIVCALLLTLQFGHPQRFLAFKITAALMFMPIVVGKGVLYPLNPPCWSLLAEMIVNLGFAAVARVLTERRLKLLVFIGLIAFCVAVYHARNSTDIGFMSFDWLSGIARAAFSFSLGVLLCRLHARGALVRFRIPAWAPVTLVVISFCLPATTVWYDLAVIVLFYPCIVALSLGSEPENPAVDRVFGLAGFISYPLYALHWPLIQLIYAAVPSSSLTIIGLAFATACVPMAYLAGRYFDLPVQAWLRQRRPSLFVKQPTCLPAD